MEITLLASSIDNQGKTKKYGRIAGCLIAFACRLAKALYGDDACISLIPKTALIKHYMQKYYMLYAGCQLYLEGVLLNKLLNEYHI
jgi:hypothetical protein